MFEEIRAGKIWSGGFDLNGGWVPLYTWHKIHAGLIDAHRLAGNPRAMPILLGVAGYMAGVLGPLVAQRANLDGLHANAQFPKLFRLARI